MGLGILGARLALDRQPDVCARDPHARGRPRPRRRAAGPRRTGSRESSTASTRSPGTPPSDPELDRDVRRRRRSRAGRSNKTALQDEAGLEPDARMPLLGVVSRLVKEKGFDIAAPADPALARPRRTVRPARHGRPRARARVRAVRDALSPPGERAAALRRPLRPADLRRRGRARCSPRATSPAAWRR